MIVSGVPAKDASGNTDYMLKGYLNYGSERIETFSYAPSAAPYDIPDKQAYIFNWKDAEFLLPCSGEYQFTAYLVCGSMNGEETGPKTTITINLTKTDESTNWGPGLPNTTVESYDLGQMQGKDKTITIEEEGYTWTINGQDITNVPEENISLAITKNPDAFQSNGVEDFFGDTIASKFSIEHTGDFGFKATLDYSVGAEYTGQELNSKIEEPVADTETEADASELEATDDEQANETADGAETPSIMPFPLIGIVVVLIVIFVILFIKTKKK